MDQEKITRAARLLREARNVVVLTGAGIGRHSGIPDFRSESGLWSQDDPMEAISIASFRANPQRFYRWLQPLLKLMEDATPNPAHLVLAELEAMGIVRAVVTQNIDGLHQQAGSKVVHELHGTMESATCFHCGAHSPVAPLLDDMREARAPRCACGGPFKPDITFFGENLPEQTFLLSQRAMEQCDVLLVVATSLVVNPAAGLPLIALHGGARVIIINMSDTYIDGYAEVALREDVAEALPAILAAIKEGA